MFLRVEENYNECRRYFLGDREIPSGQSGTACIQWPDGNIEDIRYYSWEEPDGNMTLLFSSNIHGYVITIYLSQIDIISIQPDITEK